MKKIIIDGYNLEEIREAKKKLKINEVIIGTASQNYIASVNNSDSNEYINFASEIKNSYFKDCFLNQNSTVTFVMKLSKDILLTDGDLTYLVSNIWYTVLSEYLPLELYASKIRTLKNECIADFVSDTSHEEHNIIIGYINLGNEFISPSNEELVINRDKKGCCNVNKENFREIYNKVCTYIEKLLEV